MGEHHLGKAQASQRQANRHRGGDRSEAGQRLAAQPVNQVQLPLSTRAGCDPSGAYATRLIVVATQTQYTRAMKSAVIPQIRVEPELRAELESVLRQGETLTEFVETTVRNAIAFRRVQTAFQARAQAASEEYHRTGVSVPVETALQGLQSKLDAKRTKLRR